MARHLDHRILLIEETDGWRVEQDRRLLIDQLTYDEACAYAEKKRLPEDPVIAIDRDGYEQDITLSLRQKRRR